MIQAPPPPTEDRNGPFNPQIALRVAIVGTVALAMFAVIFFRLWFLQVLSGNQYLAQASVQAQRSVSIAAPRGEILDRNGAVMVSSTEVPTVEISAADLPVPITTAEMAVAGDRPPAADARLYARLARVLQLPQRPAACAIDGKEAPPNGTYSHIRLTPIACDVAQGVASIGDFDRVTIQQDVPSDVWFYLGEQAADFPGVVVQQQYFRQYPDGNLAAQVLGTVGRIDPAELTDPRFKGVGVNDSVGQSGLEFEYNQALQGTDGEERIKVNADGQFEGYGAQSNPTPGENLQLTIDSKLQQVGQQALATSVAENGTSVGQNSGGAFVALDPQNGQVYAMGSDPTFKPSLFTHPIGTAQYQADFGAGSGYPLLNRAIQSAGPTGSTFKVITATAALQSGSWLLGQTYDDTGQFCFPGTTDCLHNSGHAAYGPVDLQSAIQVSDDNFFYNLGYRMNSANAQGGPLQAWARQYGIGQHTGVDLPGETAGNLPTPQERDHLNAEEAECDDASGSFRYTNAAGTQTAAHPPAGAAGEGWHRSPRHAPGGCGLAVYPFEYWTAGDNVNTGVGQGDDQVTPLQLAVVYSAIENGGTIVTPHVGEDIQSANGTTLQQIDPGPKRHLRIAAAYLDAIRQGLQEAAGTPQGTSYDVMGHFPLAVYGKTGTAQYIPPDGVEQDTAWYACYVPASETTKPIVVVVTVALGGFGDVAAAPVAHEILSQWYLGHPGSFTDGVEVGDGL